MILSSKITLIDANTGKANKLAEFIVDYRKATEFYVDWLWTNCNINEQKYRVPKFIESNIKPTDTELSARALKCAATQASGMVRSRVNKLSRMKFMICKLQRENKDTSKLQSKYDRLLNKLKKPKTNMVLPELNSICCNWVIKKTSRYNAVVVLSSLGKKYENIIIPVKKTKHFNDLSSIGEQMTSFLLSDNAIHVRFKINVPEKTKGTTEGGDQGMRTCMTLSDGQTTSKDIHGHDLASICHKISKKKKGSKAFRRAQAHRTNYINYCINRLVLNNIKRINLEKLRNVGKGQRKSRYLQSFAHKEIRVAMAKTCHLNGVRLVETSNAYRSQRCSHCGFVHKSSRRGELFICKACNFKCNADLNAATNHKLKLFDLPSRFRHLPNKTTGFYWSSKGLTDVNGLELTVPVA